MVKIIIKKNVENEKKKICRREKQSSKCISKVNFHRLMLIKIYKAEKVKNTKIKQHKEDSRFLLDHKFLL